MWWNYQCGHKPPPGAGRGGSSQTAVKFVWDLATTVEVTRPPSLVSFPCAFPAGATAVERAAAAAASFVVHVVLVSWISAKVGVTKRGPAPAPVRARWGATRFEDLPVVEPPPALEIHWATVQHEPQENPRQHEPNVIRANSDRKLL